MIWQKVHPAAVMDHLGLIPNLIAEFDARPASKQIEDNYSYGGGWNPMSGFKLLSDGNIQYPGDPALRVLWETRLRDETIRVYEHAWVSITQPDGTFEVSRMD
jgi:hypothetical protein